MKYQIYPFHGRSQKLDEKLTNLFGQVDEEENCWHFEGTLDQFYSLYQDKFMYVPQKGYSIIFVTEYNSFGQR